MAIMKKEKIIWRFLLVFLFVNQILMVSPMIRPVSAATSEVYVPDSSVTYRINYTVSYRSNDYSAKYVKIWISRLENWTNSEPGNITNLQESKILSKTEPTNPDIYTHDSSDAYNNSYDYYYKTLGGFGQDQFLTVKYEYELTSRGHKWDVPTSLTLANYDDTSTLYKYYTAAQPLCEVSDATIKSTAATITAGKTSIYDQAKAIYLYIVNDIDYVLGGDALGAKAALSTKSGDCSEFSSLMVALLRAQGIPARKVLGLGIVNGSIASATPKFDIKTGEKWTYSITGGTSFPGHAWVQYFVPSIGWVTCDPTWGQAFVSYGEDYVLQYFNQIDYLHLITSVGDWFQDGIDPALVVPGSSVQGMAEFPYLWPIGSYSINPTFQFDMDFEVLQVKIGAAASALPQEMIIYILGSIGTIVILALVFVSYSKKKKKGVNKRPKGRSEYYE
jgi:transglutaminase-like putative cysteine protease